MTVDQISNMRCTQASGSSIDAVRSNLEAIARTHRVSVPELLKSAEAAGPGGPPYLNRALVLSKRLDKLEDNG